MLKNPTKKSHSFNYRNKPPACSSVTQNKFLVLNLWDFFGIFLNYCVVPVCANIHQKFLIGPTIKLFFCENPYFHFIIHCISEKRKLVGQNWVFCGFFLMVAFYCCGIFGHTWNRFIFQSWTQDAILEICHQAWKR